MTTKIIPRSLGTHDGSFHADEVTACALLLLFNLIDQDKIFRTRESAQLSTCEYVCDVGGIYDPKILRFDHHQSEYSGSFSSAGMVLLHLKDQGVLDENSYTFFNQALVRGVDAHDIGEDPQIPGLCTYSHIIANYAPVPYTTEKEPLDNAFFEALSFAKQLLERFWKRYCYTQSCKEVVANTMEQHKSCLFFEEQIPWVELFFELGGEQHPAEFVIMPSGSHWKLRGVPPNYADRMAVRSPLPIEWAGLLAADLKKVSGIEGAIFCHKGRFISVWETREDALKALDMVLKKIKERE